MTISVTGAPFGYRVHVDGAHVASFVKRFEARRNAIERAMEARAKGIDVTVTGVIG